MSCLVFYDYIECFPKDTVWQKRLFIHWVVYRQDFEPHFGVLPEPGQSYWDLNQKTEFLEFVNKLFDVEDQGDTLILTHQKSKEQLSIYLLHIETVGPTVYWVNGKQRARTKTLRIIKIGKTKLLCPLKFLRPRPYV